MKFYLTVLAFIAAGLAILAYTRGNPFDTQTSFDRDLEYVVAIHLRNEDLATQRLALEKQIARNVGNALEKFDARVIDYDAFQSLLFDGVGEWLEKKTFEQVKSSYTIHLDQQEIESLADYHRSDEGQEYLRLVHSPDETPPELVEAFYEGPGRALAEHAQDFTNDLMKHSAEIKSDIGEFLSMRRVADIAARPGVVAFDGDRKRSDVVAALRAAHDAYQ